MNDSELQTLERYFALMNANGASQVYRTALSAGVLDVLDRGPRELAELANECGTQRRPTQLLLSALQSLGLVTTVAASGQAANHWLLTDLARMLLWGQYRELGDPYWNYLPEFLKTGAPLKRMDAPEESEAHYQAQAASLRWMLAPAAEAAVEALNIGRQRRALNILDVGAGSAVWSLSIARRDSAARVTAVDWPAVLEVAQETAESWGVGDTLSVLPGNYHEVAFPAEHYDLVIVANVTHLESSERNASLFQRIYGALKPGGEIAVVDVLPTGGESELATALYQLGLALRTEQGRVFSQAELTQLLEQVGFDTPRLIPLPAPPHLVGMLLAVRRP